jgi:uncharacterized protein (TIGR00269 family)
MECSICRKNEAFYFRVYEGVKLCKSCFKRSIEKKVRKTILKYKMFDREDRIAVAVSGGKDSLTLLTILKKIESKFPSAKLLAFLIDEGIKGYRDEALKIAEEHCKALNVPLKAFSFKDFYGLTMDEIISINPLVFPCAYCGVLRRKAINKAAKILKADKVATAHNLDDEAQTFLLNIFHGDIYRLTRLGPKLIDLENRFTPKVKPLYEIPEKEITIYAYISNIRFQASPCPYAYSALRNDIRELLNKIEEKHPSVKYTVVNSMKKVKEALEKQKIKLNKCEICGEPTPSNICEACLMLKNLYIKSCQ